MPTNMFVSIVRNRSLSVFKEKRLKKKLYLAGYSSNGQYSPLPMKISGDSTRPLRPFPPASAAPSPDSDLQPLRRATRRHPRTPSTRLRRAGGHTGKRSRPETPLFKWKIHDGVRERSVGGDPLEEVGRKKEAPPHASVSARKLAAGMWRMQLPEEAAGDSGSRR